MKTTAQIADEIIDIAFCGDKVAQQAIRDLLDQEFPERRDPTKLFIIQCQLCKIAFKNMADFQSHVPTCTKKVMR